MKRIAMLLVFLVSSLGMAQNKALFDQGKEQYKTGKYQEAINNWEQILENGAHSASLYFNIGNAHYKMNHIGPSIYYYEKALQMDPRNKDIKNNLAFAQNATIDAIEPLPKTFFAQWDERILNLMGFDGWAWVSAGAALWFTLFFLQYYFASETRRKRLYFVGFFVSLFVVGMAFTMAFRTYNNAQNKREAIVFAPSTEVKSEPRMKEATIFMLHEGTKVQILAEEDNWYRISLADGKDGWLPQSDLKEL